MSESGDGSVKGEARVEGVTESWCSGSDRWRLGWAEAGR